MNRSSRTLLVVVLLGIGGVVSLGYLAQRYGKMLPAGGPTLGQELSQVDAFIAVRRAIRQELDDQGERPRPTAVRAARDLALLDTGLDMEAYARLRERYRQWREGKLDSSQPMARALERRRAELRQLDLGRHESLDS